MAQTDEAHMTDERERLVEDISDLERAKARAMSVLLNAMRELSGADDLVPGYDDLPNLLSPSEVGRLVGWSKRWVIDNIEFFNARRDSNGYYKIPKTAVLRYLWTRTEKVEP